MIDAQTRQSWSVLAPVTERQIEILSREALVFYTELHRRFNAERLELLQQRHRRQAEIDTRAFPDFLPETRYVRESDWRVDSVPADLLDRRVEITGPVDRKMMINALNSGASCFMADFEDAHAPTWPATLDGQVNLRDAVRGEMEYPTAEGKRYRLNEDPATLLVRPRGWHLPEANLEVDGEPASASLFDFALYFYHNAQPLLERGSGVYLYLPKLQHYLEARLWNDVFATAESWFGVPHGTIKATVLIEHILAAFQMEEILYELRHHSAGLNCGRWDYIFSYIKTFARWHECIVPDRAQVTMTAPFLRAYTLGCIQACHKRCTFAIGGMSAYIPVKNDPRANEQALRRVREDKRREASDGHDGTWVAHPALVPVALAEFQAVLGPRLNQLERQREDVVLSAEVLLAAPRGTITEQGVRMNIRVAVQYLAAWLGGQGCVPLYNLMEDAATAEISRAQIWQWVHNPRGVLEDGRQVTLCLVDAFLQEEVEAIAREQKPEGLTERQLRQAACLFQQLVESESIDEFLTLKAYPLLQARPPHAK